MNKHSTSSRKDATGAPDPPGRDPAEFNAWLHRLRNEVNSMQMATSAALMLLDADRSGPARENLERARNACRRCAQLLNDQQLLDDHRQEE